MRERLKVFTLTSGEGSTVSDYDLQNNVNEWLADEGGRITHVTQSESHQPGRAQHITICVWYEPGTSGKDEAK